ncbi:MAG TPA: short-chain dehydrogenase [Gammaproteobacteria bacterium]|nr:short-chain dehydrogenase [Gammaproteobacteria bacterium]|tara:strand:+ start:87 stop:860 length:774 start_codon:yes stop_codon:yes gene_type:complete
MKVKDKIAVITGGASGIGAALARRFRTEGAKAIAVADIQESLLQEVAAEVDGMAVTCNVADEDDIQNLVSEVEDTLGPIDIFCSNAGIARLGDEDEPNDEWQMNWDIHVMAHVYAVRAVAPGMAARGSGYLIHTASAAGLLSHIQSATYSVTKHAAVAFAEWVSIKYRDQGICVSVLAPQAVRTPMTDRPEGAIVASLDGMIEPEDLTDYVIETMAKEEFLMIPHQEVKGYMARKNEDIDRWLVGMNRWRTKSGPAR